MERTAASARAGNEPRILRETDQWLILDKPDCWHTAAKTVPGTVFTSAPDIESWLREKFNWASPLDEAGIVHRLDFETSGCLLVAKSESEQQRLREMFQGHGSAIRKIYLAIVEPGMAPSGEFRLYFTSRYKRSKKVTVRDSGELRHQGRCRWRNLPSPSAGGVGGEGASLPSPSGRGGRGEGEHASAPFPASPHVAPSRRERAFDLLEIELVGPGRRHQIRAGLAYLGHPLVGDTLYSGQPLPSPPGRAIGGDGGPVFFLHAWKLTIDTIETIAPVPSNWPRGAEPGN